jgi:hypothetical protein
LDEIPVHDLILLDRRQIEEWEGEDHLSNKEESVAV